MFIIIIKDQLFFQNDQEMYDPIYDDNEMEVDQTYNTADQDGELGKECTCTIKKLL